MVSKVLFWVFFPLPPCANGFGASETEVFLSLQAVSEAPVQVFNHRLLSLPGLTSPLYQLTCRAPGHI